MAEKDFVMVHGRFSGFGQPVKWIAADILRIKDVILVELSDVIQDEASRESSRAVFPCSEASSQTDRGEMYRNIRLKLHKKENPHVGLYR